MSYFVINISHQYLCSLKSKYFLRHLTLSGLKCGEKKGAAIRRQCLEALTIQLTQESFREAWTQAGARGHFILASLPQE